MAASRVDVLYLAFGGGLGHVTRAAAILRQVRRREASILALTTAPHPLPLLREGIPHLQAPATDPARLAPWVAQIVDAHRPRVFLVDVFPHGPAGELADLLPRMRCQRVLVYRHQQETYEAAARSLMPHFDRILLAEAPATPLAIPAVDCWPILLRDADELLPRAAAKAMLGVGDDMPVALAVSSGDPTWTAGFFALLRKLWTRLRPACALRLASPVASPAPDVVRPYPVLDLLNGVDLLIGAAGCNLYSETVAAGVPAIWLPQPRRFDDQAWRAREGRTVASPEALERAICDALAHMPAMRAAAQYANGAVVAAEAIAALLSREEPRPPRSHPTAILAAMPPRESPH